MNQAMFYAMASFTTLKLGMTDTMALHNLMGPEDGQDTLSEPVYLASVPGAGMRVSTQPGAKTVLA